MIESRKQAVSIRMNSTDVRKVKKVASRLGVRDSDVIRFAVKSMLARLGPLYDPEAHGRNLVPVFVESGADLLRFFEFSCADSVGRLLLFDARLVTPVTDEKRCVRHRNDKGLQHWLTTFHRRRDNEPPTDTERTHNDPLTRVVRS